MPPRFLAHQQVPPVREVIGRHIIIEQAAAAFTIDAFGNTERDFSAEYGAAAVTGNAGGTPHSHPGWRAGTAAKVTWGSVIGQLDG